MICSGTLSLSMAPSTNESARTFPIRRAEPAGLTRSTAGEPPTALRGRPKRRRLWAGADGNSDDRNSGDNAFYSSTFRANASLKARYAAIEWSR